MDESARPMTRVVKTCVIAVLVSVSASVLLYFLAWAYVLHQAAKNVENLLIFQRGIHHYVQQVMLPALNEYKAKGEIPEDFYAPELFSSSFMVRLQHRFYNQERQMRGRAPIYYKMAAINPRNPVNKANPQEAKLIRMFNQDRSRTEYSEVVEEDGKKYLYVAMPFLENKKNCLRCHGARQDAPVQLQELYPGEGGFNEQEGEIRAIISVRTPLGQEYFTVYIIVVAVLAGLLTIGVLFWLNRRLHGKVASRTVALAREIGERELAERRIFEAFAQFSAVLDSIEAVVYVADMASHELLFVNKYGRMVCGKDGEEMVGKICWQTLQAGQAGPCSFCANSRLVDEQGEPAGVSVRELQNTCDNEWYECRDQAIRWTDGRLVRLEIATNVTARRQAETVKTRLEQQLRQAQKMEAVGTLAGGIAHDFNNILTPILGYAELVQEELVPGSDAWTNQGEIVQAANRAKELVKHILAFSRESEQERKPIPVQPLLKESIKLLRSSIPSTIEIRQDIDPGCGLILADPTQIHQIVMNLCTNAYHAMRESGGVLAVALKEVEFSAHDYPGKLGLSFGPYLKLEVSDTGCGIADEVKERIFEPYFTTKGVGEGTGMGLAIVHGIVQSHHGHITCYSEIAKGSTFRVYLPVVAGAGRKAEERPVEVLHGSERILVVDDEPSVVLLERRILEGLGYRVTVAASSLEALTVFRDDPAAFDLLLTDMTMPHLTGAQLVQEVRAIRAELPVILCTGFSETINGDKAKALGINAYVMKPLTRKELALVIRKVLDGG